MPGTILITGAGRRVGRALALALAEDGYDIAVHYNRSADEAGAVATEIRAKGCRAVTVQADLADLDSVLGLIPRATEAIGPITGLINNASVYERDQFPGASPESWRRHIDSNLTAPVFLCQQFALALRYGVEGNIINFLDQKLWNLSPDYFSYTMSKAALGTLTSLLAMELAPAVRVNAVAPGLTLPSGPQTELQFQRAHKNTPLGRGPTVEDIYQGVRYLLTAPAVTGQTLILDAGKHLVPNPTRDDLKAD